MKKQATDWEKIFTIHIFNKSHVSRIYKQVLPLNNKKPNNLMLKWTKYLKRHFTKGNIQMANKSMKDAQH